MEQHRWRRFKLDILSKAESENFSTTYLKTVRSSKLREETFCEYMANAVVHEGGKSGFYKIDSNDDKMVFKKVPTMS